MTKRFWRGYNGKTWWFTRLTGSNSISERDLSRGYFRGTKSSPYKTTNGSKIYGDAGFVYREYATGESRVIAEVSVK